MTPAFLKALSYTLGFEGGMSNHPADRGGKTNQGITQQTYDAWRLSRKLPRQSVSLLAEEEMRAIYHENYWKAVNGDALPEKVASVVFDMAVHSGVWNAKIALQRAARTMADGVIGPVTVAAVKSTPDIVLRFLKRRAALLQDAITTRPTNVVFLEGWINRLLDQAWRRE